MGLLRNGITFIHFDETYMNQQKLQRYARENLDFRQMQHVNLYCEEAAMTSLKQQLEKRSQKGITFIGSGNYHYVSFLLSKEITTPFSLVLFDNHTDLGTDHNQEANSLLSCGSWVSFCLGEIPLLQQVIIIGPTTVIANHSTTPRVSILQFDGRHPYSIKSLLSAIQTQNVYISIDKDVLNPNDVATNWDQGIMDLNTLTNYLGTIIQNKQVEGIDICGEAHLSPIDYLLPSYQAMIRKNEKANLDILQTCLKWSRLKTRGA